MARNFGVNTTELATETPLLEEASYAGVITGAAVVGKENKQHITVQRARSDRWDKEAWDEEKQRKGMFPYTGTETDLEIVGTIYFGVTLNSKSAIQQLQVDEPKVFGGQIRLKFNVGQDDKGEPLKDEAGNLIGWTLNTKANPTYANWLIALGLEDVDFASQVDFEYDENILETMTDIPEIWKTIPDIVDILNSLVYQRAYFSLVCEAANNLPCKVSVLKRPESKNSTTQVNTISTGSFNNFCGIIKYTDGDENDLS